MARVPMVVTVDSECRRCGGKGMGTDIYCPCVKLEPLPKSMPDTLTVPPKDTPAAVLREATFGLAESSDFQGDLCARCGEPHGEGCGR